MDQTVGVSRPDAMTAARGLVAERFPDAEQAETNLRSRAKLAVGPAVGRTDGTFDDDLELTSSTSSGSTAVLEFTARTNYPLSRHSSGALIFASC